MLKKTVTFKDLDGQDVTEDFYFNLSGVELAEMEIGDNGIGERLQRITESDDTALIFAEFKHILTKAIGQRSEDGRRFIKNQEAIDNFFQSNAYEVMFFEWITDPQAAAEFINGLMPSDLESLLTKIGAQQKPTEDIQLPAEVPAWIKEDRDPTDKELREMTPEQMRDAWARREARRAAQP